MSDIDILKRQALPGEPRHNDGIGLVQTAEASLGIKAHMDLLHWLQGDVQRFLPHEVLIAGWGDFEQSDVRFDVVSAVPHLRTEALYALGDANRPAGEACRNSDEATDFTECGVVPFLVRMRDRWRAVDCSPVIALRKGQNNGMDFICPRCDPEAAGFLRTIRSCVIHGVHDRRQKLECIYVFLSTNELPDPFFLRNLGFLLPYVDHSLRRVSHLPIQEGAQKPVRPNPGALEDQAALSQREVEIMEWVRIGKTNFEIGVILNLSAFTVKNHLQRIYKKVGTSGRAHTVTKLNERKS
jgi:transcriptional regulator EpsA